MTAQELNLPNLKLTVTEQETIQQLFARLNTPVEELVNNTIFASIEALQQKIYQANVDAGWWTNLATMEPKPKGDITEILAKLALMHSEVSECVEGVRKGLMDDHLTHRPMAEVEMADAFIRGMDLAGHEGWDLAGAIREKLAYNAQRADHKIANRLADGGKKA